MKAAFVCENRDAIAAAYDEPTRRLLAGKDSDKVYSKEDILCERSDTSALEVIFSTWGMPVLSEEEIRRHLPRLQLVFYAAGSVQDFAAPFLSSGVRVFSAYRANAIPVAEFTVSQILLALKGVQRSTCLCKRDRQLALAQTLSRPGVYGAKVGLFGLGAIGALVAERLKPFDITVYGYDKFLSDAQMAALGCEKRTPEEIFHTCDVISNHLANKPELIGFFDRRLFSLMKPNATFLNTGRGAQVNNEDLAAALREKQGRTAILDVTEPEVLPEDSPLMDCGNLFLTPHIAGSLSREIFRMGDYMKEEYERILSGEAPRYEVKKEQLAVMA